MCGEYQETDQEVREEECQGCYNVPCTCLPDDCNVDPEYRCPNCNGLLDSMSYCEGCQTY